MRVTRAAEDPSIAYSPRPNFDRPRRTNTDHAPKGSSTLARRLNLVAAPLTGRPSGSMTPRVASPRVTLQESSAFPADTCVQGIGTLGDGLGYPVRKSTLLPVGARAYVPARRGAIEPAASDENAQLQHLRTAMESMTCFELQWGLVRAELETAIAKHKSGAKIELVEGVMTTCEDRKNLQDSNETKMVFEGQDEWSKARNAVGDQTQELEENRVAFIRRVNQLKESVMESLEEINGVVTECESPRNMKKLTKYMHQALDILNAMDTIISQEEGLTSMSTEKINALTASGKFGRFAETQEGFGSLFGVELDCPEAFVKFGREGMGKMPLNARVQRAVKPGTHTQDTRKVAKEHRRGVKKMPVLVGEGIQRLGSLRLQGG